MKDRFRANLTGKNSWLRLLLMALPVIVWVVSNTVYNGFVKNSFISYYSSEEMMRASLAANYFILLSTAPLMLFATAAAALISRAIGQGRPEAVKRITTDSFIFVIPLTLLIPVIGLLGIGPYIFSLGLDEIIRHVSTDLARNYLLIWYMGMPLLAISLVGCYALLAAGNGWLPSVITVFTVLLNSLLDFVLITGVDIFPGLGLTGAGIAALLTRGATAFLPLLVLIFYYNMLTIKMPKLGEFLSSLLNLLYIWGPALAIQLAIWGFYSFYNMYLFRNGSLSVAATSIAQNIKMLAMTPILALPMVTLPFYGQNVGAGRGERALKGYHIFNIVSLGAGLFLTIAALGLAFILGPFLWSSSKLPEGTLPFLFAISLAIGAEGVLMNTNALFYGSRKPLWALLISLSGLLLLTAPLSWLGSKLYGSLGIAIGGSLASFSTAGLAWLLAWLILRKSPNAEQSIQQKEEAAGGAHYE